MGMPKINAIKQHPQFPRRDLPGLLFSVRPGKPVFLQPLEPQAESIAVPVHAFDQAPVPVAEQEQGSGHGRPVHLLLNNFRQTVHLFAHVCDPRADIDFQTGEIQHHTKAASTSRRRAEENPAGTKMRNRRSISMMISVEPPEVAGGAMRTKPGSAAWAVDVFLTRFIQ
jgi:hypothetical protein